MKNLTPPRFVAALSLVVVAGATALCGCYRPQVVVGPPAHIESESSLVAKLPQIAGLKLHVFNTGANKVSSLLVGSPAPWRPAPAFVIEHPDHGLIVFDCGLGPEVGKKQDKALHPITRLLFKTRSRVGFDLASQMRKAGLDPGDVKTVILSHLHFDHVGAAEAFTNAVFVVGLGERENATSRMNGFEPSHTDWIAEGAWREIDFSQNKPFATFDHSVDLFGDGSIRLFAGGGHTHGGLGALVALGDGPALLTGDIVVHFDWLASDDVQRIVTNAERAAKVRNEIRRFTELVPNTTVFPGHDLSHAPEGRADIVLHRGSPEADLFLPNSWPLN